MESKGPRVFFVAHSWLVGVFFLGELGDKSDT